MFYLETMRRGFVLVSNLLEDVWQDAEAAMRALFPPDSPGMDFGGVPFPTYTALDQVTLHPNILSFARRYLNSDVLLTQSEAWCKSDRGVDQRRDFGNHSFVRPSSEPDALAAIVYFDNVEETVAVAFAETAGWGQPIIA